MDIPTRNYLTKKVEKLLKYHENIHKCAIYKSVNERVEMIMNTADEYLNATNPDNEKSRFSFCDHTAIFHINGIIYDVDVNTLYVVIYKKVLNNDSLLEINTSLSSFREFICSERPISRDELRRWMFYFEDDSGVVLNKADVKVSVFVGFDELQSVEMTESHEHELILIGLDVDTYKVI